MIHPEMLARAVRRMAFALMLASVGQATAAGLASGPMAGYSGRDHVLVWLMTDADARVSLDYWPEDQPKRIFSSARVRAGAAGGRAVQIRIDGLAPGTRYGYRVRLDGRVVSPAVRLGFVTQPPAGDAPRDFSIATGSCAYLADAPDRDESVSAAFGIFDTMADRRPDLMLWLGDTIYFRDEDLEPDARSRMNARWLATRSYPPLQRLLQTGHHYAIWDDHDYGPDNSDRSFALKSTSLDLFRRYWANGSYGLPAAPGIYAKVSFEDADIFLLDDRTYRDDDAADAQDGTMLGSVQFEWLKRELAQSRARFKLIANGSRMLTDRPSAERRGGEGWHNHPAERGAFLQWLADKQIDGVLFISGDIHYTHITERERPGNYPLVELTCSPLTSRVHPRPDPVRPVAETLVLERNFCTLDFSGPADAREILISAWRADGSRIWARRYAAAGLRSN